MMDSNEASGRSPRRLGSYTTARVRAGRVERLERHALRLSRDAARLGLPPPSRGEIERLFLATAREAFGSGDGILRVEWSCPVEAANTAAGAPELIATPRPIGPDPKQWRAVCANAAHPGPEARANTKHVDVAAYDLGRAQIREARVDEVLLFDRAGWLIEGARSNLIAVLEDGRIVTPDLALGGVEGLGLTVLMETHPEIGFARIRVAELEAARELMAVNAVRGVVPVVQLDGRPIASGEIGPHTRRLAAPFGVVDYSP